MKQKACSIVTVALFLALVALVPLYWLLFPRKTFSDSERRYLAEPPKLSAADLKDWSFDDAAETYLADQLPCRDALVGLNAYTVLLTGRQVSAEIWRDRAGYLVEPPVKVAPASRIVGIRFWLILVALFTSSTASMMQSMGNSLALVV